MSNSNGNGPLSAPYVITLGWKTLPIGGGGFVRSLNIAADGTMIGTTDTTGAYLYNYTTNSWTQLVTPSSMPSAYVAANYGWGFNGVYSIGIAPSNTQILYMNFNNLMWKSTNQGTTWVQLTGWGTKNCPANDNTNYAQTGQKIAVDPNNTNIVYAGAATAGLFVSTDGGTTWNQVTAVPAGTGAGTTGIVFGPASNVVGGVTQIIYACRAGTGVYVTTNGGSSWALTSSGPTTVQNAQLDNSGNYWCAGNAANVWKYTPGTGWANLETGPYNGMWAVAVNPFNNSQIVGVDEAGYITYSSNGGSTWTGISFYVSLNSTVIPWLGPTSTQSNGVFFIECGNAIFSPLTNGQLIWSNGVGIWNMSVPATWNGSSPTLTWNDAPIGSVGIENLVTNEICVPPGTGQVIASVWDRSTFWLTPGTYPTKYLPVTNGQITPAWSCDYASSDSTFVCAIGSGGIGYSHNNGSSWTNFPTTPSGTFNGGVIAASTPTNVIVAPEVGNPQYTTDGGNTWNTISISGITFSGWLAFEPDGCWRLICADRVNANTFYLYFAGTGLYISTNSGASWTKQFSGSISGNSSWEGIQCPQLKAVPNNAGQLFYTPGPIGQFTGATITSPTAVPFSRSTNAGVTWTAVSNVRLVSTFGFGAPQPGGGGYPAVYIVGFVNQGSGYVYGTWRSDDNCSTWNYLGQFTGPNGLSCPISMSGDMSNYGVAYVGLSGFGSCGSLAQFGR
jgi:hypothetical protein